MGTRTAIAQDHAERVLAGIAAAIRIGERVGAPEAAIAELRAIHRRLHQQGLRHELQGSLPV